MIGSKLTDALSKQFHAELSSAYLYMAMSSYASCKGLPGTSNWFSIQVREEMAHAEKFYDYLSSHGMQVALMDIEAPTADFTSLLDLFERTLAHEQKVTGLINDLANLARDERDHATEIFLQWFITEQVEEEENARTILDRARLAGTDGTGLFMIDNELAARVPTPPAQEQ